MIEKNVEQLITLDTAIYRACNGLSGVPAMDAVMLFVSGKAVWLLAALFFCGWVVAFRHKRAFRFILVVLIGAPVLAARSAGLVPAQAGGKRSGQALSPDEISGLLTLEESALKLGIDVPALRNLLGVQPDLPESTRLFDLEDLDENLTLHAIRDLLAGLPAAE